MSVDIGAKIRKLRKAENLTLEELASRSELTKGFLSQLERNLTSPSISTLEDILGALGTDLSEFFKEEPEHQIVFGEDDYYVDQQEGYSISWIVPRARKNDMEPILVSLAPGGRSMDVESHEGEEFGYVVKGAVHLEFEDGQHLIVHHKETFYLENPQAHHLVNKGKVPATVLWISAPPVF